MKNKMNKKGDGGLSTQKLIIILIVVVVLVIVVLAVGKSLFRDIEWAKYLPGFNSSKPRVIDMEIFRFKIADDKLEYYDGTTWNEFKAGASVEANGKTVDSKTLIADFSKNFLYIIKDITEISPACNIKDSRTGEDRTDFFGGGGSCAAWNDASKLNIPVIISYTKNGKPDSVKTCFSEKDYNVEKDKALVVNLAKELKEGQTCEGWKIN